MGAHVIAHWKAEHQRIDAFELWCWRRLLSVPWTARRSDQSIHHHNVFLVMNTSKIYYLSNVQVYNIVLLIIVTTL